MAVFRDEPYLAQCFEVTISGISDDGRAVKGRFAAVRGLDAEVDVIEYRTGADDLAVRRLPGTKRFSNLVLERGMVGDLTLWSWFKEVLDGRLRRADVVVTLLDEARQPVLRWRAVRAWPRRWSGPVLDARAGAVAMETLELVHEGLELE